jgi:hypothetical protein
VVEYVTFRPTYLFGCIVGFKFQEYTVARCPQPPRPAVCQRGWETYPRGAPGVW